MNSVKPGKRLDCADYPSIFLRITYETEAVVNELNKAKKKTGLFINRSNSHFLR